MTIDSVASDETMEAMVQAASVPNLASLFKKAKAKGVIEPTYEYGGKNTSSGPADGEVLTNKSAGAGWTNVPSNTITALASDLNQIN